MKHTVKQSGFSIIETMLAAFVLTAGITAAVAVFGPSIKFSGLSRDRVIASALAQEGVELIKNVRDNNMLNGAFNADINTDGTYCMDYKDVKPSSCGSGQLYRDGIWYVHDVTSVTTYFKRRIVVDNSPDKIAIRSYVVWHDGTFPSSPSDCTVNKKCTLAQIVLTNWK